MNCCAPGNHPKEDASSSKSTWSQIPSLVKYGALAGIAIIALRAFRIPLATAIPYGVFLLCPLMHVFMMKGHGAHDQANQKNSVHDQASDNSGDHSSCHQEKEKKV